MPVSQYTVIRDTREKPDHGWLWAKSKYCQGTINKKLDQGDYAIDGYEDYMIIERKGSVSEWAGNLGVQWDRFERELERSRHIKNVWIVLEFDMRDIMNFPVGSGIPKRKWASLRFKGPFVLKRTLEIMSKYPNVSIVLAGGSGKEVASSIFKRTTESINAGKSKRQNKPE